MSPNVSLSLSQITKTYCKEIKSKLCICTFPSTIEIPVANTTKEEHQIFELLFLIDSD